jgi:hypothetical protein
MNSESRPSIRFSLQKRHHAVPRFLTKVVSAYKIISLHQLLNCDERSSPLEFRGFQPPDQGRVIRSLI